MNFSVVITDTCMEMQLVAVDCGLYIYCTVIMFFKCTASDTTVGTCTVVL